ncbi:hypothetical protein ACRS7B_02615 [Staphylococcus aureus]
MQVGVEHREIGTSISADNASWGGPTQRISKKEILQAMQVGGQHREIGTPISTDNASWGR